MLNWFRSKLLGLFKGGFVRDIAKLSLGTLGGRLIALAALPLVTRLYTPVDFAVLAVYVAVVSTVAAAACFRLDVAIPLADTDSDASHLLVLAVLGAAVVAFLMAIAIAAAPGLVIKALGRQELTQFLWLLPVGVFMAGSYSALQYWATRARRFGSIATTRLTQAMSGVLASLGFGWFGFAPLGLLVGNILSTGAGGVRLGTEAVIRDGPWLRAVSLSGMHASLVRYRHYIYYSTPEALANVLGAQLPIVLISSVAGSDAGFLFLAMQIMAVPMSLLGSSISQVYMSRAPAELLAGTLAPFTYSVMKRLLYVGLGPLVFMGLVAPFAFPLVFGSDWARSGTIVTYLVPWMALQFIASPVSMVMYVTGQQRSMLVLTSLGSIFRIGSIPFASLISWGSPVGSFIAASSAFYLVCLIRFGYAAGVIGKGQG